MRAFATSLATAAATLVAAAAPAHAAAPLVDTMVVFKDDSAVTGTVRAGKAKVKVGGRSCGVPAGTALAALVALKPAKLGLTDYGACSKSPSDAAGLYVRSIGADRARREDGWVYKVGRKAAPAGAADPTGPFGRGLIRSGQSVLWFYCNADPGQEGCQRTLELKAKPRAGSIDFTVTGYDDNGKGVPVGDATVASENVAVKTDSTGRASLELGPATYSFYASGDGVVRSLPVEATVR